MFIKSFSCSFMDTIRLRLCLYCDIFYTHISFISISKIGTLDRQTREREREICLKTRKIIKIYCFSIVCHIVHNRENRDCSLLWNWNILKCKTLPRMLSVADSKKILYIFWFFYELLQPYFARNISLRLDLTSFGPKLEIVAFLWKSFMMPSIRTDNSRRYNTRLRLDDNLWFQLSSRERVKEFQQSRSCAGGSAVAFPAYWMAPRP